MGMQPKILQSLPLFSGFERIHKRNTLRRETDFLVDIIRQKKEQAVLG